MSHESDNCGIRWSPLESNPEVWNEVIAKLGLAGEFANKTAFCDVFGLDPEVLEFVPKPALAVCLCYPINDAMTSYSEKVQAEQLEKLSASTADSAAAAAASSVAASWFCKQTVGNACGYMAIFHALANVDRSLSGSVKASCKPGSFLELLLSKTQNMAPEERADFLVAGDAGKELDSAQTVAGEQGDTKAEEYSDTHLHFVTFTVMQGRLVELDGRKRFPIDHGPATPEQLLAKSAEAIMKIADMGGCGEFSLLALAAKQQDE